MYFRTLPLSTLLWPSRGGTYPRGQADGWYVTRAWDIEESQKDFGWEAIHSYDSASRLEMKIAWMSQGVRLDLLLRMLCVR